LILTASASGKELMLAMGTGTIETHYPLAGSADSVLTPDFRILLAGPGVFHFAFASDAQGNTCVRALPSDTASVIVNELMGDGVYQVRPGEQVLFRAGTVKDASGEVPAGCGCPAPPAAPQPEVAQSAQAPPVQRTPPPAIPGASVTAPLPPTAANDVRVTVDAPFVFRGDEVAAIPPAPRVAHLRLERLTPPMLPSPSPPSPVAAAEGSAANLPPQRNPAPRKGLFGHLRRFLAAVFR
jgi:hypothetical protein